MKETSKTKHLVHPELLPVLEMIPKFHLNGETLSTLRQMMNQSSAVADADSSEILVEEKFIPGYKGAPDIRVLIYRPKTLRKSRPAILHIHGGGYVAGRPESQEEGNLLFIQELDCVVVSVDYRLAPEVPYPGLDHVKERL